MDGMGPLIFSIIFLAIVVFLIASFWRVFTKAGKPGWASIIPIYNTYIMVKIANRPGWWILLILFIPFVNIIILLIVSIDIAKAFGKSTLFGVLGLWLFSFIGYPILAFGSSQYSSNLQSPSSTVNPPVTPPPQASSLPPPPLTVPQTV